MIKKIEEFREKFMNRKSLENTVEKLVGENSFPIERAEKLKESLKNIEKSKYVLYNLAVHTAMGGIFAFDIVPLPFGTISRVSWVLGNKLYHGIKGDKEKKKVHSYKVLLVSAIPWIGYFAYTIPLKEINEDLCYVYANHVSYTRKNRSLKEYLEKKPRVIRKIMNRLLIPKDLRKIYK